jgi:hypothetical protein
MCDVSRDSAWQYSRSFQGHHTPTLLPRDSTPHSYSPPQGQRMSQEQEIDQFCPVEDQFWRSGADNDTLCFIQRRLHGRATRPTRATRGPRPAGVPVPVLGAPARLESLVDRCRCWDAACTCRQCDDGDPKQGLGIAPGHLGAWNMAFKGRLRYGLELETAARRPSPPGSSRDLRFETPRAKRRRPSISGRLKARFFCFI